MTRNAEIDILIVEDSPEDVDLARIILTRGTLKYRLHVAADGVEALSFLRHEGAYHSAPRPLLVLLDWNLPGKHGSEVLRDIKEDPALCIIPVVVLSTSQAPDDVNRAYRLGANCYVTKPAELDEFTETIRALESFWFKIAQLPENR